LARVVDDPIAVRRGEEDAIVRISIRPLLDDERHIDGEGPNGSRCEREDGIGRLWLARRRERVPCHRSLIPGIDQLDDVFGRSRVGNPHLQGRAEDPGAPGNLALARPEERGELDQAPTDPPRGAYATRVDLN